MLSSNHPEWLTWPPPHQPRIVETSPGEQPVVLFLLRMRTTRRSDWAQLVALARGTTTGLLNARRPGGSDFFWPGSGQSQHRRLYGQADIGIPETDTELISSRKDNSVSVPIPHRLHLNSWPHVPSCVLFGAMPPQNALNSRAASLKLT